jgi:hypothetical protein
MRLSAVSDVTTSRCPVRITAAGPTRAPGSAAWRSASACASSSRPRSAAAAIGTITLSPRDTCTVQTSASAGITMRTSSASTRSGRIEEVRAMLARESVSARVRAVSASRSAST